MAERTSVIKRCVCDLDWILIIEITNKCTQTKIFYIVLGLFVLLKAKSDHNWNDRVNSIQRCVRMLMRNWTLSIYWWLWWIQWWRGGSWALEVSLISIMHQTAHKHNTDHLILLILMTKQNTTSWPAHVRLVMSECVLCQIYDLCRESDKTCSWAYSTRADINYHSHNTTQVIVQTHTFLHGEHTHTQ